MVELKIQVADGYIRHNHNEKEYKLNVSRVCADGDVVNAIFFECSHTLKMAYTGLPYQFEFQDAPSTVGDITPPRIAGKIEKILVDLTTKTALNGDKLIMPARHSILWEWYTYPSYTMWERGGMISVNVEYPVFYTESVCAAIKHAAEARKNYLFNKWNVQTYVDNMYKDFAERCQERAKLYAHLGEVSVKTPSGLGNPISVLMKVS